MFYGLGELSTPQSKLKPQERGVFGRSAIRAPMGVIECFPFWAVGGLRADDLYPQRNP